MGKVIIITSGKGGVGKTTVTANLGMGLAGMPAQVVMLDMDAGLRNLDVVLGMENAFTYHIADVLNHQCRLRQALVRDKRTPNLWLLPGAPQKEETDSIQEDFSLLIEELKKEFDYVLLDCPAGIGRIFSMCMEVADEAVVVTAPEVSAIRDADKVISLLLKREGLSIKLLVNRIHIELVKRGMMLSPEDVGEVLDTDLIGAVLEDETVLVALSEGELVITLDDSAAGECFRRICKRLTGEVLPLSVSPVYGSQLKRFCGFFFKMPEVFKVR